MAKKGRTRKRKHSKKRRVSGGPSVIGRRGTKRRHHRKHKMSGPRKRRRRIGAEGSAATEYLGLLLGTGVGMIGSNLATVAISSSAGGFTTGGLAASAVFKGAASIGVFALGRETLKNNSFVKGVGIGIGGSAINDAVSLIPGVRMNGPVTIRINDTPQRNNVRQLPVNSLGKMNVLAKPNEYEDDYSFAM